MRLGILWFECKMLNKALEAKGIPRINKKSPGHEYRGIKITICSKTALLSDNIHLLCGFRAVVGFYGQVI